MSKAAVYPGTFDPITMGHVNIIKRAIKIFDKVIVAVAVDTFKEPLFTAEERAKMIRDTFKNNPKVEVETFEGLLAEYVKKKGVNVILRGLRTVEDFEYELQMSLANKKLYPECETLFMMTEGEYSYYSSSLIKEIASLGGDVRKMVPKPVKNMLDKKFRRKKR